MIYLMMVLSMAFANPPDEVEWRAMNSLETTEKVYLLLRGGHNALYDIGSCKNGKCTTVTDCKNVRPIGWQPLDLED